MKFLITALLVFLAACSHTPPRSNVPPPPLTFVYTGNLGNELEPCGCRDRPVGGVARKKTFLDQRRAKHENILQIDTGDAFFESHRLHPDLREQLLFKSRQVVEAYNRLGTDVLIPGDRDFAGGREHLLSLAKEARFAVISANLVHAVSGVRLFPGSVILKRKNYKIGVIGVTDSTSINEDRSDEVKALPLEEAIQQELSALEGKVDLVVVAAHLDQKPALDLAEKFPEISVWFTADTGGTDFPEIRGRQLFLTPMIQGQKLGVLKFTPFSPISLWVHTEQQLKIQSEMDSLQEDINALLAVPKEELQDFMAVSLATKQRELESWTAKRARGRPGELVFEHAMIEMHEEYEAKNSVAEVVEFYKKSVAKGNFRDRLKEKVEPLSYPDLQKLPELLRPKGEIQPGAQGVSTFVRCESCHQEQAAFQRKTPHYSAMLSLFSKGQHQNLECLTCHTIGYREPKGWVDPRALVTTKRPPQFDEAAFFSRIFRGDKGGALDATTQQKRWKTLHTRYVQALKPWLRAENQVYVGVQCEHCHGRREGHPEQSEGFPDAVSQAACLTCHTPEHSDGFSFESMRPLVACPKMKQRKK